MCGLYPTVDRYRRSLRAVIRRLVNVLEPGFEPMVRACRLSVTGPAAPEGSDT